jgi:hypothetical protein
VRASRSRAVRDWLLQPLLRSLLVQDRLLAALQRLSLLHEKSLLLIRVENPSCTKSRGNRDQRMAQRGLAVREPDPAAAGVATRFEMRAANYRAVVILAALAVR